MTQAHITDKTNYQRLFRDRSASTKESLKTLSFNVYSSRHLISPLTKQIKYQPCNRPILPPITKDDNRNQRKLKRPSYRKSIYYSLVSNTPPIDLPVITTNRTKPELLTLLQDETLIHFQYHHAPPPTPSDDQLGRILIELNQNEESTTDISTEDNESGLVPYRLPALKQSTKQLRKEKNSPPKHNITILSNYYQTLYSKN
ncbi:unnamed protein product [Adineta steineri]|uniref:Uncharacterized protein n=1 Tax=Adineta steineri TaxID=433720 RepID=A0A818QLX5_9BILA|nr:unnamed protein product [Adineta steineri]CAF3639074.1 unnamed protein product [Adineta steineri]